MSEFRNIRITYQAINGGGNYSHHSPMMETYEAAEAWIKNDAELNGEYRIEKRYDLAGAKSFGDWLRGFGK